MPTLKQLNEFDATAFTNAVGPLFEHSPWVARESWVQRPFRDEPELHAKLCATMRAGSHDQQLALIQAHPDLAGRLARERKLTAESAREQASAGLDQVSDAELDQFQRLNAAYRERFGFPFIICARLNARQAILQAMENRITHSPQEEFETALSEIEKIAWLRLQDLVQG